MRLMSPLGRWPLLFFLDVAPFDFFSLPGRFHPVLD